ncbi:MAG: DUF1822 family protein [Cyanobacteria bacterium CRU_2_1]|nr:DUF1822 family protein [Cyanobacteria bacterium CRU_2_1]
MRSSVINNNNPWFDPLFNPLFDSEVLPIDAIVLSEDQIDRAMQWSQTATDETQQWQQYLNALAQFGFVQWLQDRSPELYPTLIQPSDSENPFQLLQIGEFKLSLLTMGSLTDQYISVPKAIVDQPEYIPHFYVLIEVLEELEQINLYGYLSYTQLIQHCQSSRLQPASDRTYQLALTWVDPDPNTLLLYLRCLDPAAIPLPIAQKPSLQSQESEIKSPPHSPTPPINVGLWLRDHLDRIAQELAWVLLPPLSPETGEFRGNRSSLEQVDPIRFHISRSPVEQFDAVITKLINQGMPIPAQARGAYRNLEWGNVALRLYAVTWEIMTSEQTPEWTLLLILGTQSGQSLPIGTRLLVQDNIQVLVDETFTENRQESYLFARVVGVQDEHFRATIDFTNGAVITIPFSFYLAS